MIVFLRDLSFEPGVDDITDETFIVDCIQNAVQSRSPGRRFVTYDKFRKLAFPDLPAKSTPRQPRYMAMVLERPKVRERIAGLGLRYIIFVGGVTETHAGGGMVCGGAAGGVGCLGLITWDKESRLGASVMDLAGEGELETSQASAMGTAWLAIVFVFPLGLPAATESDVCAQQGRKIATLLTDRDAGKAQ